MSVLRLPRTLVKYGFSLLYNQLAFSYDMIAWLVSLGQWADWRRTTIPLLRPGLTLELAYGTGGLHLDLHQVGVNLVGIDLSPYMARLAATRLRRNGFPLSLAQARVQALPFPDASFANVVATFPTDYIFEPETLREVRRVLIDQPQLPGQLIIVLQGDLQGTGPLNQLIEWLYTITGQREMIDQDLLAPFKAAGFDPRWQIGQYRSVRASLIVAQKIT